MSGLRRFEDETKHALFKLPVRKRKSIVLPRMLGGNRATTGSARQAAMPMLENTIAVFAPVCSAATPQSVLPSATLP